MRETLVPQPYLAQFAPRDNTVLTVAVVLADRLRLDRLRLDRRRLDVATSDDVAHDHADVALAILACVRRRCLAPTAIKQQRDRSDARAVALAIRGDLRKHAHAHRCLRS